MYLKVEQQFKDNHLNIYKHNWTKLKGQLKNKEELILYSPGSRDFIQNYKKRIIKEVYNNKFLNILSIRLLLLIIITPHLILFILHLITMIEIHQGVGTIKNTMTIFQLDDQKQSQLGKSLLMIQKEAIQNLQLCLKIKLQLN